VHGKEESTSFLEAKEREKKETELEARAARKEKKGGVGPSVAVRFWRKEKGKKKGLHG